VFEGEALAPRVLADKLTVSTTEELRALHQRLALLVAN
jgi:hypothetical protein